MNDLLTELLGQIIGGQDVNRDPKQFLQFDLDCSKVKQCRAWQWVNQQIQVTEFGVGPLENRPKDSWIA